MPYLADVNSGEDPFVKIEFPTRKRGQYRGVPVKWDYGESDFVGPYLGRKTNVSSYTVLGTRWRTQRRPLDHTGERARSDTSRREATARQPHLMMSQSVSQPTLTPRTQTKLLERRPELHRRTYTDAQPWMYEGRTNYKYQIPARGQGWHSISHGGRMTELPEIMNRGLKMRFAEMEAKIM